MRVRHSGFGFYWNSWDSVAINNINAQQLIKRIFVRPAEELYDLVADPEEQNNLATNPNFASMLAELRRKINQWMH